MEIENPSSVRKSIAVIFPVTGGDDLQGVKRALASVFAQAYAPSAVYIYASGMVSRELDAYLESLTEQGFRGGIKIEITKKLQNMSAAVARNALLECASEPVLAFLDSDDEWHPKHLEDFAGLAPNDGSFLYFTDYAMRQSAFRVSFGPIKQTIDYLLHQPILMSSTIVGKSSIRFIDIRAEDFAFILENLVAADTVIHNPRERVIYDQIRRKSKGVWFKVFRTFVLMKTITGSYAKAIILTAVFLLSFAKRRIMARLTVKQIPMVAMQKHKP